MFKGDRAKYHTLAVLASSVLELRNYNNTNISILLMLLHMLFLIISFLLVPCLLCSLCPRAASVYSYTCYASKLKL